MRNGLLIADSAHKFSDKALSRFEPGDTFGLVSALTGQKYPVSVFAGEDAEVVEIPVAKPGNYLKEHRDIAIKMLSQYMQELRSIHKYLTRMNKREVRYFHPEKLVADAVRFRITLKRNFAAIVESSFFAALSLNCLNYRLTSDASDSNAA